MTSSTVIDIETDTNSFFFKGNVVEWETKLRSNCSEESDAEQNADDHCYYDDDGRDSHDKYKYTIIAL